MINENMVLYKAKSLFGLDNAALASLNCVCHLFCLELFSRLKDKKAANDERIIYLVAVNCLYYSILENTDSGCSVESVKAGDVIAVGEKFRDLLPIKEALISSERFEVPGWLEVDIEKLSGNVISLPSRDQISGDINEQLIVELYSK